MKIHANKKTITRTILTALALINACLEMFGISAIPIENETITTLISVIALIISTVWSWWKNNSFTKNAVINDTYLKNLKQDDWKELK